MSTSAKAVPRIIASKRAGLHFCLYEEFRNGLPKNCSKIVPEFGARRLLFFRKFQ
jgi:hypothetical protein